MFLLLLMFIYIPLPQGVMTAFAVCSFFIALGKMDKISMGISLLLFAPPVFGAMFTLIPMPIPAFAFCLLIGLYFLYPFLSKGRFSSALLLRITLLLFLFVVFFFLGPLHPYSFSKIVGIFIRGGVAFFAWYVFVSDRDVDVRKISAILLSVSFLYMALSFDFFGFSRPKGFFDFTFYRDSYVALVHSGDELPVNYHSVGVNAMLALAFLLSQPSLQNVFSKKNILYLLLLFVVVAISQARQAILGSLILVVFRVLLERKTSFSWFVVGGLLMVMSFFLLSTFDVVFWSSSPNTLGSLLNRDYNGVWPLVRESPLLGAGLGGFSSDGTRAYPHNIVLELLCEFGFLGTFFVLCLVFGRIFFLKNPLRRSVANGSLFSIVLLAFLMRSMISGDLTESIVFLMSVLVYSYYSNVVVEAEE